MAKTSKVLLTSITLGLVLRLININQSLWLDEASQALQSLRPVSEIWFSRQGDFHPPLFYFITHFWLLISHSEIWLRLLPISFGLINIYAIYLLGKNLFPISTIQIGRLRFSLGEISALLLAIAPFHIYYSQEFRSYSFLCLLATLSVLFFVERRFLRLTLINILLMYTHYSALFFLTFQLIYCLFTTKAYFKRYLTSLFLSFLLYLPWLPQLLIQLKAGLGLSSYLPGWSQVLSLSAVKAVPLTLFKLTAGRINFISPVFYSIYVALVLATLCFTSFLAKTTAKLLFFWMWIPILTMLLISFWLPQNQPFRVIYILPAIILLFSQASIRFPRLVLTLIIYISLTGNLLYYTRPRLQREQWRQTAEFLVSQKTPMVVKFSESFAPLKWYAPQLEVIPAVTQFPAQKSSVTYALSTSLKNKSSVYLIDYLTGLTDPNRQVESALSSLDFFNQKTIDFPGVGFVVKYTRL